MGEMENAYKILVRKPETKRLHGRPRLIRENNISDYKKVQQEGVDWIHLAQDTGHFEHGNEVFG
jgi:hypothetical protein